MELKISLWIFAIHGNNPGLINILQDNQIEPDDFTYEKCQYNDIVDYILNDLFHDNNIDFPLEKKIKIFCVIFIQCIIILCTWQIISKTTWNYENLKLINICNARLQYH